MAVRSRIGSSRRVDILCPYNAMEIRFIACDTYSSAIKLHGMAIHFLAPGMLEYIADLELCQDIVIDGEVDGGLRAYRVAVSAGLHVFLRARTLHDVHVLVFAKIGF